MVRATENVMLSVVETSGWGKSHRDYKPNGSVILTRFFGKLLRATATRAGRMTVAVNVPPCVAVGGLR
jgi:hypothetical protein